MPAVNTVKYNWYQSRDDDNIQNAQEHTKTLRDLKLWTYTISADAHEFKHLP